jgi:hypothetical protein
LSKNKNVKILLDGLTPIPSVRALSIAFIPFKKPIKHATINENNMTIFIDRIFIVLKGKPLSSL